MNANIITVVGRLAAKPQLKGYKKADGTDGFRGFMRVAVTRLGDLGKPRDQQRTNFIPVVLWGALAQRSAQHLDTGTEVTVTGEMIAESQKLEDGKYRDYIHIQANSVQFGRRSAKNSTPAGDVTSQLAAMQARLDAITAGAGTSATPQANPGLVEGTNPFDVGADAGRGAAA